MDTIPIEQRFKVGDRIRVRQDSEYFDQNEPQGLIIRSIEDDYPRGYCIMTEDNCYRHTDVEHYSEVVPGSSSKFKIGDIVVGNKRSNRYSVTTEGWIGRVTKISTLDSRIDVESISDSQKGDEAYDVEAGRFDLAVSPELNEGDIAMLIGDSYCSGYKIGDIVTIDHINPGSNLIVVTKDAGGKRYFAKHDLFLVRRAEKPLDICPFELTTLPETGWCPDAKASLGHYLAAKMGTEYIPCGRKGYAWNSHSYWSIASDSGKNIYPYKSLQSLISTPTAAPSTNLDLSFLKEDVKLEPLTIREIRSSDDNVKSHLAYLKEKDPIIPHEVPLEFRDIVVSNKRSTTIYVGRPEPIEIAGLVSRVAKPTIILRKKEYINTGLIVPLNSIKNRTIK